MTDPITTRLENVTSRLETLVALLSNHSAAATSTTSSTMPLSRASQAWSSFYNQNVQPFVSIANLTNETQQIGQWTETSFEKIGELIRASSECKKPNDAELLNFLQPVIDIINQASNNCDNRSEYFNHQKAFAETVSSLSWVTSLAPGQIVQDQLEAAEFYLIKILTQGKKLSGDKGEHFTKYANANKNLLKEMLELVQQNFKMGLDWNSRANQELKNLHSSNASDDVGAAAPPPPGPPPSTAELHAPPESKAAATTTGGMSAVFESLRSTNVTAGLKKVTKEMKSKYNEAPPLQPKVAAMASSVVSTVKAAVASVPKKEPRMFLNKGTWFIENYEGGNLNVPDVQLKESVYIMKCKNTAIHIPKKCKSIQVDGCNRVEVEFTNVVSIFEIFNSQRIAIHAIEACPSIAIDKSSGCQIHLTVDSVKNPPQIVTSNVSELNLVVPGKTENDDPIEIPLPEQYVTIYKAGKISTEAVAHSAN